MKLGDVLRKERTQAKLDAEAMARRLGVSAEEYGRLEGGGSDAEVWGPALARIAIALSLPMSRLLAESGRSVDTKPGQAGPRIREARERTKVSVDALVEATKLTREQYELLERGESPVESVGPLLLAFAEAVEQPVFNLLYPCGLPFQELDDYP